MTLEKIKVATIYFRNRSESGSFSGRLKNIEIIHKAVESVSFCENFVSGSIFNWTTFYRKLRAIYLVISYTIKGNIPPLQSVVFSDLPITDLESFNPDLFVVEGARGALVVHLLKKKFPKAKIVVDLDDLMSRRMELLLKSNFYLSLGMVGSKLPKIIQKISQSRILNRLILHYEKLALRSAEGFLMSNTNLVVFVSPYECEMVRRSRTWSHSDASIESVLPAVSVPSVYTRFSASKFCRFAFIGSDTQVQNSTTIDYLKNLWDSNNISIPLYIYGNQTRNYTVSNPNFIVHGPVSEISEVYNGGTCLITPTILKGGIKTKVLEAFAYGAPVVGNSASFEGIDQILGISIDSDLDLLNFLTSHDIAERLEESVENAREYVIENYSEDVFFRKWRAILMAEISGN